MEEIKVGEYVRTYKGKIYKVTNVYVLKVTCGHTSLRYNTIKKQNPNITDLIEEGDYINGCEVTQVTATQLIVRDENGLSMWKKKDVEKHIKHIVTHEQYNSIKYVIGE